MTRTIAIAAAVLLFTAGSASAQKIDANGKCHDAKGKMAPMSVCKPAASASAKQCKTGKPCGNACIAKDKVCKK